MQYLDPYYFYDPAHLSDTPVVIEVGAITPERAKAFMDLHTEVRYVIYEADPRNWKLLWDHCTQCEGLNLNAWNDPSATGLFIIHAALADYDGKVVVHTYDNPHSSSIFPRHRIDLEGKDLRDANVVRAISLASMLDENGIDELDLLLMNCEGSELAAMLSISENPDLCNRVRQICTSFHCDHCSIYSHDQKDMAMDALSQMYEIYPGRDKTYQHYLFVRS